MRVRVRACVRAFMQPSVCACACVRVCARARVRASFIQPTANKEEMLSISQERLTVDIEIDSRILPVEKLAHILIYNFDFRMI